MKCIHDNLTEYGNKAVERFLDKCKADGSYKKVYEDFEDGTCLLEDTMENLLDVCAWLYLAYDRHVFDVLDKWGKDGCDYVWKFQTGIELSFEEVENELHRMFNK